MKCPKCGEKLEKVREWNEETFGIENNPLSEVCRNENCHGWYCNVCGEWHPYGTTCSIKLGKEAHGLEAFRLEAEEK